MTGRISDLQVIAAGVGVDVQQLPGEIESLDQFGLQGLWIDLGRVHPSGCDDGFGERPVVRSGHPEGFQLPDESLSFLGPKLVQRCFGVDVRFAQADGR